MSRAAIIQGFVSGAYAERRAPKPKRLDELAARGIGAALRRYRARSGPSERVAQRAVSLSAKLEDCTEAELEAEFEAVRSALSEHGLAAELLPRSLAFVRELAARRIGLRPYPVQLVGAHVMLDGRVAEMQTGEGKTLTAALAATVAALAGLPVHVISVNDYLVQRDAEEMSPLYAASGLGVGTIQAGMTPEERREQYSRDITYVSNKELAFDYLKDRITLGRHDHRTRLQLERLTHDVPRSERLLLRGLVFGIVDEADSVLVDEARTPLIITAGGGDGHLDDEVFRSAIDLARHLDEDLHFTVHARDRFVALTETGRIALAEAGEAEGGIWTGPNRRERMVVQALAALHLYQRDHDYLIDDDRVQIIDASTGRRMPDRNWEHGLHQMIQAKEGVDITGETAPLAKISYQRFFQRYRHLSGMTGTAKEVAGELWSVYRLGVTSVPTHRPVIRKDLGERVLSTAEERWDAIASCVHELQKAGRPVLIGTRSLHASESLSEKLEAAGIQHQVLNARQDAEEADVVRGAGIAGTVTVATNMAGRGTDIKPDPRAIEVGGLHVIASERNEARRIDRQLFGRAGRQGNPGSFERIVSLEDEILEDHLGGLAAWAHTAGPRHQGWLLTLAQMRAERMHKRIRADVLRSDETDREQLAFAGEAE